MAREERKKTFRESVSLSFTFESLDFVYSGYFHDTTQNVPIVCFTSHIRDLHTGFFETFQLPDFSEFCLSAYKSGVKNV